jgi:CheY-like chemotaxis protein
MPNSILVVDDSPTVRRAIRFLLESSGLVVCAEAVDGQDAIEKAPEVQPDLIILDYSMPRMNGAEAARHLRKIHPAVPIILYSVHAATAGTHWPVPEGVTKVVSKNEDLRPHIAKLLEPLP